MIFDTDIIIDASRGRKYAFDLISNHGERVITAVTFMEFIPYCRNKNELNNFNKMLEVSRFSLLPITENDSLLARDLVLTYCLSHSMLMGDALNAAIAINRGETFATLNVKHYKHLTNLLLMVVTRGV